MIRVSILGTGNVATHLFGAFLKHTKVQVVQIVGRNEKVLDEFGSETAVTSDFTKIADTDILFIAVNDDAIKKVSEHLRDSQALVVHSSGSVSIDALSVCKRRGVFYPLQSFSKERTVDMKSVPLCLEANEASDLKLLKTLAGMVSDKIYDVDSDQRKALHLAAVFVNNFTNHMYHIGKEICDEKGLPFEIIQPLIQETLRKTEQLSPYEAQTGPARRGDAKTIEKHMHQLKNTEYMAVYKAVSASIGKLYRNSK